MTLPILLLLAEDHALSDLGSLRAALAAVGVTVRTPQDETRLGRSLSGKLHQQLAICTAALVVGPDGPLTLQAFHAFQAKVALGQNAKLFLMTDREATVPEHLYGVAVVLPPLTSDHLALSIRSALENCSELSTLRGPALDNPNGPFISNEAWPVAFSAPAWPENMANRAFEEVRLLYWEGLFRTGYLEQWARRTAISNWLLNQTGERDPLNRSLILSKGIAYAHMVRGSRPAAIRALRKAGDAAYDARSRRARSYVFEYRADLAVRDGNIGAAVEYYEKAQQDVSGVEAREVELKAALATSLEAGFGTRPTLDRLSVLRDEFASLLNYRTGVVDIMMGRELALAGEPREALAFVRKGEAFFRDVLPMPRNLRCATLLREAIEAGRSVAELERPL